MEQQLHFEGDADAMIPPNDPVQAYHEAVEERFGIRDLIVIGVLNDNPEENGVFNPRTLGIVKEFSEKIALLPGIKAIRDEDVASVATMDNITGTIDGMAVDPFMEQVPERQAAFEELKHAVREQHVCQLDRLTRWDGAADHGQNGARRGHP